MHESEVTQLCPTPSLTSLLILVLPSPMLLPEYLNTSLFPAKRFSDFPLLLVGAFAAQVSHMTMSACTLHPGPTFPIPIHTPTPLPSSSQIVNHHLHVEE